jgi:hypothetical protein
MPATAGRGALTIALYPYPYPYPYPLSAIPTPTPCKDSVRRLPGFSGLGLGCGAYSRFLKGLLADSCQQRDYRPYSFPLAVQIHLTPYSVSFSLVKLEK